MWLACVESKSFAKSLIVVQSSSAVEVFGHEDGQTRFELRESRYRKVFPCVLVIVLVIIDGGSKNGNSIIVTHFTRHVQSGLYYRSHT